MVVTTLRDLPPLKGVLLDYGGVLAEEGFRRGLYAIARKNAQPFDAVLEALLTEARRLAHLIITEYMMTIGLPHDVILHLGRDLTVEFPPSLKQLTLPDLQALLAKIDPTPDSAHGSGAVDWSSLPDRLHFIVDLFRCYHDAADLLDPPFTAEQVTALKAGRLPDGRM